jgi:hypothetical protein
MPQVTAVLMNVIRKLLTMPEMLIDILLRFYYGFDCLGSIDSLIDIVHP